MPGAGEHCCSPPSPCSIPTAGICTAATAPCRSVPAPHCVHPASTKLPHARPTAPGCCVSTRQHEGSDPGCPRWRWGRGGTAGQGRDKDSSVGSAVPGRSLVGHSLVGHVLHADPAPHAHHEALHLTLVDTACDAEMPILTPRSAPRVGCSLQWEHSERTNPPPPSPAPVFRPSPGCSPPTPEAEPC